MSEQTRVFGTGATRDTDDNKLDYEGFLSPAVLKRFAEYMHAARLRNIPEGQKIRASDNWQKGIPIEAYMKSLIRHTMEAWSQYRKYSQANQETLCAIMFNAMGMLFEELKADDRRNTAGCQSMSTVQKEQSFDPQI